MIEFVEQHIHKFSEAQHEPQMAVGGSPGAWAKQVAPEVENRLFERPLDRHELRRQCAVPTTTAEECFFLCMAWGGMNRRHGRSLWQRRKAWVPLLQELRQTTVPRGDAFDRFMKLRHEGNLPGMRAAYFTKLIFFLRSEADGYILDQWTGKSVNLLTGRPVVSLNGLGLVDDQNTGTQYETFCCTIEALAARLGREPEGVEERLMSEGRGRGEWRNYVRNHWPP
jgi:hypothetical protein